MTDKFDVDAASDYLRLTLLSFDLGIIGRTHFEARLNLLRTVASSQFGAVQYATDLVGESAGEVEFPQFGDGERGNSSSGPIVTSGPHFDATNNSIAFKITGGTLNNWEFHQADDDFFPSIPHGHEHGRKQPKLDVYLGWVYNKDDKVRRIDRASIVMLWNDRGFRDFARIAINYYLDRYPAYSGWAVSDPRILPAIRRGRRFR